ncbi:hypothetical protein [Sideroxydans sp. CL21]|nr:hypothetical protein [Sideroxydans sp. CL21]
MLAFSISGIRNLRLSLVKSHSACNFAFVLICYDYESSQLCHRNFTYIKLNERY